MARITPDNGGCGKANQGEGEHAMSTITVYLVLLAALLVGITLQVRWLSRVIRQPVGAPFRGNQHQENNRA